jgi:hypothetical protein
VSNKSSQRFEELTNKLNPRPRVKSRLATGRTRLHDEEKKIPSDPMHDPEKPEQITDNP